MHPLQQGLTKGVARLPNDAQLHLGAALLTAKRRADAEPLLRGLATQSDHSGLADLARLWLLAVR